MSTPTKKKKRHMRLPAGAGSVHKIGGDRQRRKPWRARVQSHVEFDAVTGAATRKYITVGYYETELDAIAALMDYRKNPFTVEASTATFADVVEMWKAKKYPSLSAATQKAYNSAYKNCEPIHSMKMRDIRTVHLENVMQSLQGGYGVQVRLKTYWGMVFKYAMEHDIIQKNYVDFVKPRDKDEGTKRSDIPAEDRRKIWAAAKAGDQAAQIALIYIYTGFRASELLEIRKEDVNLQARIMVGGMKTAAGKNRRVPIHKAILPYVECLMQTDGEYLITWKQKSGKEKKYVYNTFLVSIWNPLMERLSFSEYTPHYARHTCATMMREANVAEDLRKIILGHKSADITDRYTHYSDSMLLEAIDLLPGE